MILTRRYGEEIKIGDNIDVVVLGITGNQVRLGIKAPADQVILRKELIEQEPMLKAS